MHRKSMFTKIRYMLELAIVISIILPALAGPRTRTLSTGRFPGVTRPETVWLETVFRVCKYGFQIRGCPEDGQPWYRGDAVRVRLDAHRLRAYNLSREDVMQAMVMSTLNPPRPVGRPPGVVFNRRLLRPDQYENFILRANPEGEVVRLKDVGKAEVGR